MTDQVLVRTEGRLGRITLNRPKALNALTLDMVVCVRDALHAFEHDDAIGVVVIDGAGERGLCAGGDIRAIYNAHVAGDPAPIHFWSEEYRMNVQIAHYPKPLVAFQDGIVMGGGIGISGHAAFRIVTERSVVSMPEVAIGFIPDVGGTYLLARAPGELGTYAALTAARFGAADSILLGLADVQVPSERLALLVEQLRACAGRSDVERSMRSQQSDAAGGMLAANRGWIDVAFAADTVEEIEARLAEVDTEGAKTTVQTMARMSPSSRKVTLRALRDARHLPDLESCLRMELRIGYACLTQPDLAEGIRAMVIDKDNAPNWSPSSLNAISDAMVDAYFRPIGDHELVV